MAASGDCVTVLDRFSIEPSPKENLVSKMSLRLTYFDMLWLYAPPVQRLLFYKFPEVTQATFLDEIIPRFKRSLSYTLRKYLPLAGKLIIPPNPDSGWPELLYLDPDSVNLIVAESDADLDYLTADHAINCCELHPLVPELTERVNDSGSTLSAAIAVQATLFPNRGIAIGITNHPAAGDGRAIHRFVRTWAMYAEFGEQKGDEKINWMALPFYYRNILADPKGLGKTLWAQWKDVQKLDSQPGISTNTDKVRRTFFLKGEHIIKLQSLFPQPKQPGWRERKVNNTFKAVCAYVWTCLVKSQVPEKVAGEEEELEHNFICFGQCRTRIHCLADMNYFGNCITICKATAKHSELVGESGLLLGFELIKSSMHRKLDNGYPYGREPCGALDNAQEWLTDLKNLDPDRDAMVTNSPGFNYYYMNFGWGRPVKFEIVSIDKTGAFSLAGGRRNFRKGRQRAIEVGLCLPKARMDAFAAIFFEGLKSL